MLTVMELPKEKEDVLVSSDTDTTPWFESRRKGLHPYELWEEDDNFLTALIAEGMNIHDCPSNTDMAAFAIVGALVGALSGSLLVFTEGDSFKFDRVGADRRLWEVLLPMTERFPDSLDRSFLAAMLRKFKPEEHYSPPSRSTYASSFHDEWHYYRDGADHTVCNIKRKKLIEGREAMAQYPEPVQISIRLVAAYLPTMLKIALNEGRMPELRVAVA